MNQLALLFNTLIIHPVYKIWSVLLAFRFMRFFIIYPIIFIILHLLRKRLYRFRVQTTYPSKKKVMLEIGLCISSFICFGPYVVVAIWFYHMGWYHFYFNWNDMGTPYFFLSIILILALHEIYYYAIHRLMHTNAWLYRHVHSVHHKFHNPTVFTSYAFHPLEAIMHPLPFIIAPLIMPVYIFVPVIGLIISEIFNIIGHMGYEWVPTKWAKQALLRLVNTSTFHNYHHSHGGRTNYSLYTTVLDHLFGTHSEKSDIDLERILAQRKKHSGK